MNWDHEPNAEAAHSPIRVIRNLCLVRFVRFVRSFASRFMGKIAGEKELANRACGSSVERSAFGLFVSWLVPVV